MIVFSSQVTSIIGTEAATAEELLCPENNKQKQCFFVKLLNSRARSTCVDTDDDDDDNSSKSSSFKGRFIPTYIGRTTRSK